LSVTALTQRLAQRYGLRTSKGLLVTEVTQGGDAQRKGIRAGDIILEVNRQRVETEEEWSAIIAKRKSGDALLLLVRREGDGQAQDFIVTVRIP
jgi:serine protease Do